jgi:addiction module HigA family antidote
MPGAVGARASGRDGDEFLTPISISVYELANAIKVPRSRINDIVVGRRAITTDTALRLGRYSGTTPQFWINLQAHCDLELLTEPCCAVFARAGAGSPGAG